MQPGRTPRAQLALDAGLALAVAAYGMAAARFSATDPSEVDLLADALLVGSSLVLVARRRAPLTVLVATSVAALAYLLLDRPEVPAVPVLFAVYAAVLAGHRWLTVAVVGSAMSAGLVHTAVTGGSVASAVAHTFVLKGWLLAAGILGEVVRKQRALAEQAQQRAEAADRAREETALRLAGEERLRIARELHDSLTHSISIITVQAGVAVHLARKRGEHVDPALLAIQEASGEATRELRATLEVLRGSGEPPSATLDRLPGLVEGAARAGVRATLTVTGERPPLPAEVERTAYRVVQEALTNVARHAGPATAEVSVGYDPDALTVRVDDDGAAAPQDPVPGVGLMGMRERVVALGGRVAAGPREGGGFSVQASLPLAADQPLIRAGFRSLLDAEDDLEVVAEAGDGREALARIAEHRPDVALVDVQMPVLDGIETTRAVAADPSLAGVHVVILTNYGIDEHVFDALRAGATGFLVKDTEPVELLHAVRLAARGDALLSPSVTRRLVEEYVARPAGGGGTGPALDVLTAREREVLALVARGLSNGEIARHLTISPTTAKTHVSRTMVKLHARDRAQLVVTAYESGLVTPRTAT